jgi:hypothetical protein
LSRGKSSGKVSLSGFTLYVMATSKRTLNLCDKILSPIKNFFHLLAPNIIFIKNKSTCFKKVFKIFFHENFHDSKSSGEKFFTVT